MGGVWVIFLTVLAVLLHVNLALPKNCRTEKRCRISRTHGLKAADCYDREFSEIPKCLPGDVEIIELTHNRIRRVSKSDLSIYPKLKHLYLRDNMIDKLGRDFVDDVTGLETLDLSANSLRELPPAIFQLPSLKTLYLSNNWNVNIAETVERAKPITSPITQLHVSGLVDVEYDDLIDFPDFEEMMFLASLNISGNHYSYISPKYFAGLCNLQIIHNVNTTAEFEEDCDCIKLNKWLKERKVEFHAFVCAKMDENGCNLEISDDDKRRYHECRDKLSAYETTRKLKIVGMWLGIVLGVVILILLIYLYRRYGKAKIKEMAAKTKVTNRPANDSLIEPLNQTSKV